MKTVLKVVSVSALALIIPPALYLIYSCFKKKECVCPFYFWEKRNTIAPNLSLPQNDLHARNGPKWPYRFLGFLPSIPGASNSEFDTVQLGKVTLNRWREAFWPESSVVWLQRSIVFPSDEISFWRYSLLRGAGKPVFSQRIDNGFDDEGLDRCSGIVEKYCVTVDLRVWEDSVFLVIFNTETKESRRVLLDPIPPRRILDMQGEMFFTVAEFFDGAVVLFACECRSHLGCRIWAYKYVPDRENQDIWKMKSAKYVDAPDEEWFNTLCKVGKHAVGFYFGRNSRADPEDPRSAYIYNERKESWESVLDTELSRIHVIMDDLEVAAHIRGQYIGNLCSKVKKHEDEHFEGFLVSAPRAFAPQNLVEDGNSSPALFLVPGNNPPSLGSLAFRSLIKDHPSLLDESHQTLREIGIPPHIASTILEHKSWEDEDGESNVIQIQ